MLIGSSQLAIPLISSEVHAAHSPWLQTVDGRVHDHPEVPDRPRVIREALEAQGLAMRVPPTVHADEAIDAVHDANYHRFFREACVDIAPGTTVVPSAVSLDHRALDNADLAVQIGHYAFGQDAPLMHATYRAARVACAIALTGAAFLFLISGVDFHENIEKIEWTTIFFFIGLFIVVAGIEHAGLLSIMAQWVLDVTQGSISTAVLLILWGCTQPYVAQTHAGEALGFIPDPSKVDGCRMVSEVNSIGLAGELNSFRHAMNLTRNRLAERGATHLSIVHSKSDPIASVIRARGGRWGACEQYALADSTDSGAGVPSSRSRTGSDHTRVARRRVVRRRSRSRVAFAAQRDRGNVGSELCQHAGPSAG